jgi:hypothetical protein
VNRNVDERALAAIHEGGHAVAAHALGHPLVYASLVDGVRTRCRRGDRGAHLREAMIALAGPAAEMRYRPTRLRWEERTLWRKHWGTDLAHARQHVAAAGGTVLPTRPAIILVRRHWRAIEAVAAAIEQRGTLTGAEIDALMALARCGSRHSITSSAAACSVRGTVKPSVFAVLRLITSSNFVGCKTGKSAGLAPLRMRPT